MKGNNLLNKNHMIQRFPAIFVMTALPFAMWANNGQTVTVDGTVVNKTVKEISFNGTDAQLTFADGTTQTADMATVNISFGTTTGIKVVDQARRKAADDRIYTLSGHYVGKDKTRLPKGVYIVNGKKKIKK
jgi:immune inhibitor A